MCSFSVKVAGDASAVIQKARSAVESQKGTFNGDDQAGDFDVNVFSNHVKGSYEMVGDMMNITILKKPFFVPCSTIESFLRNQLS